MQRVLGQFPYIAQLLLYEPQVHDYYRVGVSLIMCTLILFLKPRIIIILFLNIGLQVSIIILALFLPIPKLLGYSGL